jgi:son of sevenless-like protein
LLDYNNFNGLLEILNGLDIAAVVRLQRTWAKVNIKQLLDSLREVTAPEKNFQKLREYIHHANPPIIPYLGRYLSDLTFVDDGNPNTIIEDNVELINFFKQRLIGDIILEIQTYQQVGYKFQRDPTIHSYITMFPVKTDKELFDLSLTIEPRESPNATSK